MKNWKLRIKKGVAIILAAILAVPVSVTIQKPMEVKAAKIHKAGNIAKWNDISVNDIIEAGAVVEFPNEATTQDVIYRCNSTALSPHSDYRIPSESSTMTITDPGTSNSKGDVASSIDTPSGMWIVKSKTAGANSVSGWYVLELYPLLHTDTWTSKAGTDSNANTLYAWCSTTDSSCNYTKNASNYQTSTLTYSLPSGSKLSYTGSQQGLTPVNNISSVTGSIAVASYTLTYYTDPEYQNKTTSDDGINGADGSAPANVGTYYVKATSSSGLDTLTTSYEITQIDQPATFSMTGYTYGETPSTPTLNGVGDNATPTYMYYYDSDGADLAKEWKSEEITATFLKVGTYKMYATLPATRNYKEYTSSTVTFEVSGQRMTKDDLDVTSYSGTYDADEHDISVTITNNDVKKSNSEILFYNNSTGKYDLTESPKYKDVNTANAENTYEVKYRVSADGYYDYDGSSTITITPKELKDDEVTVSADKTYDGIDTVEVNVEAETGIEGEEITISGISGTFEPQGGGKVKTSEKIKQ